MSVSLAPSNSSPTNTDRKWLLIDGIGPFFRHYNKKRINWSKIPFSSIETKNGLKPEVLRTVPSDFRKLLRQAAQLGYNAVTLDDVAHLIPCSDYSESLNGKIAAYRELFERLMQIANQEGMAVFMTMDVMFFNDALHRLIDGSHELANRWLGKNLKDLFEDFPLIAGVIMRFGESDGLDVKGDFRSELWLKRSRDAKKLLSYLLPVFETHNRTLIFRTWAVGAHPIGDLSWNPKRFEQIFGGLESKALIVSLKYGETDFFRYLGVNPLFFVSQHQKMVEFQAKREYEGFGAYPSFVGWDSEQMLLELQKAQNVIGMSVWCQTGGWGKRRQLTFLRNSSPWVELNTWVLAKLWLGETCERAIGEFAALQKADIPAEALSKFLRYSDVVIKDLLYVRELAERKLYFRRLRLPPQLFVYWDRILVDPMIKRVLGWLVQDHEAALQEGRLALERLHEMVRIAEETNIPSRGLKLQLATFEIIAAAREYYFDGDSNAEARLRELKANYKKRFKRNYSVMINLDRTRMHRVPLRWALPLMLRERSRYRMIDQVLAIRILGLLHPLVRRFRSRIGPKFARDQAMGIDTLLK